MAAVPLFSCARKHFEPLIVVGRVGWKLGRQLGCQSPLLIVATIGRRSGRRQFFSPLLRAFPSLPLAQVEFYSRMRTACSDWHTACTFFSLSLTLHCAGCILCARLLVLPPPQCVPCESEVGRLHFSYLSLLARPGRSRHHRSRNVPTTTTKPTGLLIIVTPPSVYSRADSVHSLDCPPASTFHIWSFLLDDKTHLFKVHYNRVRGSIHYNVLHFH